jgi:hypothetical protein
MDALREAFGDRILAVLCGQHTNPDPNPCDFYLWGTLKQNVYRQTLVELKN